MNLLEKLKQRWKVNSIKQVLIILLVFALTGTSVIFIRRTLKANFDWASEKWFTYTYYWLILPFYNLMLLMYGFVFGQFRFFWEFEKKTFRRLIGLFRKK